MQNSIGIIFSVKLTAQRAQLKRQSDDISESLEIARLDRDKLMEPLKQEEQEIETIMYGDTG